MRCVVFQHLDEEGPGFFGNILRAHGIALECLHLHAGDAIPPLENYDLMLVMGATQQVWQEDMFPWLVDEKTAIRHWVEELRKPYFGVCFGHQLLADILGGKVSFSVHDELGMITVTRREAMQHDPVFSALAPQSRWLQWHNAEVTQAPDRAVVAAYSQACANQAMRYGTHAVSIQFHAEALIERVDAWMSMRECIEDMASMRGAGAHDRFLAAAHKYLPEANRNAEILITHWLEINGLLQNKLETANTA